MMAVDVKIDEYDENFFVIESLTDQQLIVNAENKQILKGVLLWH